MMKRTLTLLLGLTLGLAVYAENTTDSETDAGVAPTRANVPRGDTSRLTEAEINSRVIPRRRVASPTRNVAVQRRVPDVYAGGYTTIDDGAMPAFFQNVEFELTGAYIHNGVSEPIPPVTLTSCGVAVTGSFMQPISASSGRQDVQTLEIYVLPIDQEVDIGEETVLLSTRISSSDTKSYGLGAVLSQEGVVLIRPDQPVQLLNSSAGMLTFTLRELTTGAGIDTADDDELSGLMIPGATQNGGVVLRENIRVRLMVDLNLPGADLDVPPVEFEYIGAGGGWPVRTQGALNGNGQLTLMGVQNNAYIMDCKLNFSYDGNDPSRTDQSIARVITQFNYGGQVLCRLGKPVELVKSDLGTMTLLVEPVESSE